MSMFDPVVRSPMTSQTLFSKLKYTMPVSTPPSLPAALGVEPVENEVEVAIEGSRSITIDSLEARRCVKPSIVPVIVPVA